MSEAGGRRRSNLRTALLLAAVALGFFVAVLLKHRVFGR
jgi:hypothetical protein